MPFPGFTDADTIIISGDNKLRDCSCCGEGFSCDEATCGLGADCSLAEISEGPCTSGVDVQPDCECCCVNVCDLIYFRFYADDVFIYDGCFSWSPGDGADCSITITSVNSNYNEGTGGTAYYWVLTIDADSVNSCPDFFEARFEAGEVPGVDFAFVDECFFGPLDAFLESDTSSTFETEYSTASYRLEIFGCCEGDILTYVSGVWGEDCIVV